MLFSRAILMNLVLCIVMSHHYTVHRMQVSHETIERWQEFFGKYAKERKWENESAHMKTLSSLVAWSSVKIVMGVPWHCVCAVFVCVTILSKNFWVFVLPTFGSLLDARFSFMIFSFPLAAATHYQEAICMSIEYIFNCTHAHIRSNNTMNHGKFNKLKNM